MMMYVMTATDRYYRNSEPFVVGIYTTIERARAAAVKFEFDVDARIFIEEDRDEGTVKVFKFYREVFEPECAVYTVEPQYVDEDI